MVISGKLDHTHEVDERKLERNQVRLSVKRKANSDVSERPSKSIRSELQKVEENNLTENDLKSLSMAIYRERRKRHPTLPKSREDVHTALDGMTIETSKSENMCLINDQESGIIIFSCTSNLRVLCTQVEEIFIDGTFKCCAKYFEQLYTVHGISKWTLRASYFRSCHQNLMQRTPNFSTSLAVFAQKGASRLSHVLYM